MNILLKNICFSEIWLDTLYITSILLVLLQVAGNTLVHSLVQMHVCLSMRPTGRGVDKRMERIKDEIPNIPPAAEAPSRCLCFHFRGIFFSRYPKQFDRSITLGLSRPRDDVCVAHSPP